jgi:hypothetical protein
VECDLGLELGPGGPDASGPQQNGVDDSGDNVDVAPFMQSLLEYADGRGTHLVLDCYADHRCDAVKELAERLHIHIHFRPPRLMESCSSWTAVSSAP